MILEGEYNIKNYVFNILLFHNVFKNASQISADKKRIENVYKEPHDT